MPAFILIYKSQDDRVLHTEEVVMKNLRAAKISASGNATAITSVIEIQSNLGTLLSIKRGNKWADIN